MDSSFLRYSSRPPRHKTGAIEEKLLSIGVNGSYDSEGIRVLAGVGSGGTERLRKLFFFDARGESNCSCDRHLERGICSRFHHAKHNADHQL